MNDKSRPLDFEELMNFDGKAVYLPETNCCVLVTNEFGTLLFTVPDGEFCAASEWYEFVGPAYNYCSENFNE